MTDQLKLTPEEFAQVAKALGYKNDPASTTLPGAQLHGPLQSGSNYGPLSSAGVRPGMLSTFQRPASLAEILPLVKSDVADEIVEIMTGVTAEGGTNAAGWCGNPPTNGALKVCKQHWGFGKYYVKSDLNALAEIGLRKNRADVPRQILNTGPAMHPMIPDMMWQLPDTMDQLRYEFFKTGVAAQRDIGHVVIQGDNTLAYTASQHGWTKEFLGLDGQIKTGYTDSESGALCPAADSAVMSFNADVDDTDGNGRTIVEVVTDAVYGIKEVADAVGMGDTQWAFVMRRDFFKPLTEVWACHYYTARCNTTSNAAQQQDAIAVNALREEMLRGGFLWVDGEQYPVVFDENILRETLGNQYYKADMYFVPLSWAGMPLTYIQYFDMANPYAVAYANQISKKVEYMSDGLWLVSERDTGGCMEYHFQMASRLILEAPFLAARIDDVAYYFRAPARDSIPGASLYVNGGVSYRTS